MRLNGEAEGEEVDPDDVGLSGAARLTSAPIIPHFVQTIFGPNDDTVRCPGR
jgi:hypothetical protein